MTFGTPQRLKIKYDAKEVENMKTLLKLSAFPDRPPIPSANPWELGIDYSYLKALREQFITTWSWENLEKKINEFENFTIHFEDGDRKSTRLNSSHSGESRMPSSA